MICGPRTRIEIGIAELRPDRGVSRSDDGEISADCMHKVYASHARATRTQQVTRMSVDGQDFLVPLGVRVGSPLVVDEGVHPDTGEP
jgi:hypothetical protein